MKKECLTIIELEEKIFILQTHMIALGKSKGLTNPETIKCSQDLDTLLNKYQKIKLK